MVGALIAEGAAVPAPGKIYNWRIYILALCASMGSAMFGYDSAFIGGALVLPAFKMRFGADAVTGNALAALKANTVSTFQAGCFFGAIICYAFTERWGRKYTLAACGVVFNVGVILQLASSGRSINSGCRWRLLIFIFNLSRFNRPHLRWKSHHWTRSRSIVSTCPRIHIRVLPTGDPRETDRHLRGSSSTIPSHWLLDQLCRQYPPISNFG